MEPNNKIDEALVNLTDEQLRTLNRKIIMILRLRREQKSQLAKADFNIGDTVWFQSKKGERIEGKIIKICKKNVQVLSDNKNPNYTRWVVSPAYLHHKEENKIKIAEDSREIELEE